MSNSIALEVSKRFQCDAMRAIGIVLVALGHTLGLSDAVQLWIYSFHMPLFFFLSGYVLKESRLQQSFSVNVHHYAQRLLIPYFAFSLLTYVPWVMLTRFYGADAKLGIHPLRPIAGTFYGTGIDGWLQHNSMLWFLPCLYVVHLTYKLIGSGLRQNFRILAAMILAGLGLVLSQIMPFRMPWGFEVALIGMPFYAIGNWLTCLKLKQQNNIAGVLTLSGLALVQFSCIYINGRVDMNFISLGNPILFYAGAFCGIGVMWCTVQFIPDISVVRRVASSSMLIFVTHRTLYSVLTAVLMLFVSDIQVFKNSAAGAISYAGWAVLVSVLTVDYWKKFAPVLLGNR